MRFHDLVRLAWSGCLRHRLRAALTVLGIVVGVATFVTTMSLGRGASARVGWQVEALGANVLTVFAGTSSSAGVRSSADTRAPLVVANGSCHTSRVMNTLKGSSVYPSNGPHRTKPALGAARRENAWLHPRGRRD